MAPFHWHRPIPRAGAQSLSLRAKGPNRRSRCIVQPKGGVKEVKDSREHETKPDQQLRKPRSEAGDAAARARGGRALLETEIDRQTALARHHRSHLHVEYCAGPEGGATV